MNIAHINNLAGVGSEISKGQRKQGHHVQVFTFDRTLHKMFGENYVNFNFKTVDKQGTKTNPFYLVHRQFFLNKIKDCDIWHYHYPFGGLREWLYENRNEKNKIVKHYHGDDIRGRKDNGRAIVATPDLLDYAPNSVWIKNPVDLEFISKFKTGVEEGKDKGRDKDKDSRLKLVAHYPHYKLYSSQDNYSNTLYELEKKGVIKIHEIFGLEYDKALSKLAQCDIAVGKIMPDVGWFGKFELEAMALGIPVIAFVSPALYQKYKPPIYNTTVYDFKKDLETLVHDSDTKKRLNKEGIEYVRSHDIPNVVREIDKFYLTV